MSAGEPSVARGTALVVGAALACTLLMAAPVVLSPGQRIFGSAATFAREDPDRDPLVVIDQMRTGRVPAPYLQPLTDLPGRALARLVGPVAGYNLLVLGSFPLAAAAAYLLARHVLDSHGAALVAGLAYAFLPFHVAHAAQHAHVAQTQWLPLFFLALWRCADAPDLRRAALLSGATAAVALSNFYAGLIAAVLGPVALVAYAAAAPRGNTRGRWRRAALTAAALALTAAAGLVLVHLQAPSALRPGAFAFPRSDLFLHAAKWWSYLLPPVDHPLAGPPVRLLWAGSAVEGALLEQQVGLGLSLLALGAVPVVLWMRGARDTLAVRAAPVLAAVAAAAVLCSLSPERSLGGLTFVRPAALLYEAAPMFRAYARFGVVAGLMTALLAGAGALSLWRWPTPAGPRAAALLLLLGALEYAPFPPWRSRDVLPTQAHRWLASQHGALRVLDCVPPLRLSDTLAAPLLGHEIALLGAPAPDDCAEPRLGETLQALGYTHLLLRRGTAAERWLAAEPLPAGLARGPEFPDSRVLLVEPGRPAASVAAWLGFGPREYEGQETWRWAGQTAALRLTATRALPSAVLELEMKAFPGDRHVRWLVDGRARGAFDVAAGWGRCRLPVGALEPGDTTITLSSAEPAVVASSVLHNGDDRPLALAVRDWKIEDGAR